MVRPRSLIKSARAYISTHSLTFATVGLEMMMGLASGLYACMEKGKKITKIIQIDTFPPWQSSLASKSVPPLTTTAVTAAAAASHDNNNNGMRHHQPLYTERITKKAFPFCLPPPSLPFYPPK